MSTIKQRKMTPAELRRIADLLVEVYAAAGRDVGGIMLLDESGAHELAVNKNDIQ